MYIHTCINGDDAIAEVVCIFWGIIFFPSCGSIFGTYFPLERGIWAAAAVAAAAREKKKDNATLLTVYSVHMMPFVQNHFRSLLISFSFHFSLHSNSKAKEAIFRLLIRFCVSSQISCHLNSYNFFSFIFIRIVCVCRTAIDFSAFLLCRLPFVPSQFGCIAPFSFTFSSVRHLNTIFLLLCYGFVYHSQRHIYGQVAWKKD